MNEILIEFTDRELEALIDYIKEAYYLKHIPITNINTIKAVKKLGFEL